MSQNRVAKKKTEQPLKLTVLRSAAGGNRYWWMLRSSDGRIVEFVFDHLFKRN